MTTRIDSLHLTNFRAFAELSIEFHPKLTVLTAPNGVGKTAILDALAIAWSRFAETMEGQWRGTSFSNDDIRKIVAPDGAMEPVSPGSFQANAVLCDQIATWSAVTTFGIGGPTGWTAVGDPQDIAESLRQSVIAYAERKIPEAPTLPVIAYHGTDRRWPRKRLRGPPQSADTSRLSGYTDSLSSRSGFRPLEEWFRRFAYEEQSEASSQRPSPHRPKERLAAVGRRMARKQVNAAIALGAARDELMNLG